MSRLLGVYLVPSLVALAVVFATESVFAQHLSGPVSYSISSPLESHSHESAHSRYHPSYEMRPFRDSIFEYRQSRRVAGEGAFSYFNGLRPQHVGNMIGRPSGRLPGGRRYIFDGRYFGNLNNRYYGPQYGNF